MALSDEIKRLIKVLDILRINASWYNMVVACQRYVCPNVISMTMNVIIQECIIENCFIEPYV